MENRIKYKPDAFSPSTDRWIILVLGFFTVIIAYLFPVLYWDFSLTGLSKDWSYFDALSLVLQSSIFSYGVFPLHNPWVCGGLDYLANPQTRVFSPTVIFDLLFSPNHANLLSLMTYGFFGFIGTVYLLRDFHISKRTSYIGAILFLHCNWFSFHYAAGHITFGSFQLLPLVFFCAHKMERPARFSGLMGLLTLFLLDGAIYTFIFSVLMITSTVVAGICHPLAIFSYKKERGTYLLAILAAIFLSAAKVIPLLVTFSHRKPRLELVSFSLGQSFRMLLNPFHSTQLQVSGFSEQTHEYACYFSLLSVFLVLLFIRKKAALRKNAAFLLLFLFWTWVAIGWGLTFNPWYLFQKIPIINNAHIQSRTFIVAFLFFNILLSRSLDASKNKKRLWSSLVLLLMLESIYVHSYPFGKAYMTSEAIQPVSTERLTHQKIASTISSGYDLRHYHSENGSKNCYEPAFFGTNVSAITSPHYRGEIYALQGKTNVSVEKQTPGEIIVKFDSPYPGQGTPEEGIYRAEINTNFLSGWKVTEGPGLAFKTSKNLVGVETTTIPARITLTYTPPYLRYVFGFFSLGLLLAGILLCRLLRQAFRIPMQS